MRKALRILLLVAGCAVMMATSQIDDMGRRSAFVTLGAGEAQTFTVQAHPTKAAEVKHRLHVRFSSEWKGGEGAWVVGLVSKWDAGPLQVTPRDTFTIGQELSGGWRVAFVSQVPFETRTGDGWELPEGDALLTLYAPAQVLLGELEVDLKAMEAQCKCDVYAGVSPQGGSFVPGTSADGGDGG